MVAADAAEAAADGPGEPVLERCGSPGQREESQSFFFSRRFVEKAGQSVADGACF